MAVCLSLTRKPSGSQDTPGALPSHLLLPCSRVTRPRLATRGAQDRLITCLASSLWPTFPLQAHSDLQVHQQEALTYFTVFALKPFQAGARVLPEAVFTSAQILARIAFTLVTICKERVWKLRLAGSSHRQGNDCAALVLALARKRE